jgi:hypothetical protein
MNVVSGAVVRGNSHTTLPGDSNQGAQNVPEISHPIVGTLMAIAGLGFVAGTAFMFMTALKEDVRSAKLYGLGCSLLSAGIGAVLVGAGIDVAKGGPVARVNPGDSSGTVFGHGFED